MKLLFCRSCADVVKLEPNYLRSCKCRAVEGRYLPDGLHAEVWGVCAEVIGIDNRSLVEGIAILDGKPSDIPCGPDIQAFLFPRVHERVRQRGKREGTRR